MLILNEAEAARPAIPGDHVGENHRTGRCKVCVKGVVVCVEAQVADEQLATICKVGSKVRLVQLFMERTLPLKPYIENINIECSVMAYASIEKRITGTSWIQRSYELETADQHDIASKTYHRPEQRQSSPAPWQLPCS